MKQVMQIDLDPRGYLCSIPKISFGIFIFPLRPAKEFCKRANTRFESGELKLNDPEIFDKLMKISDENLSSL